MWNGGERRLKVPSAGPHKVTRRVEMCCLAKAKTPSLRTVRRATTSTTRNQTMPTTVVLTKVRAYNNMMVSRPYDMRTSATANVVEENLEAKNLKVDPPVVPYRGDAKLLAATCTMRLA